MDGATFSPQIAPQYSRRNNYFVAGSPPPSPTYPSFCCPMMLPETSFGVGTPLPHIMTAKRSPHQGNMMANYQNSLNLEALKLQRLNLDESVDSNPTDATHCTSKSDLLHVTPNNRCTLPHHTVSPDKRTVIYTIEMVVLEHLVECFAKNKIGCRLQNKFPRSDPELKGLGATLQELYKPGLFLALAKDLFANFFVQLIIKENTPEEQVWIVPELSGLMYEMCMNRYSCRVVQKVLDKFIENGTLEQRLALSRAIRGKVLELALQMYGCRVIQPLKTIPEHQQMEILKEMEGEVCNLSTHPSGCRVIQRVLEHCSEGQRPVLDQLHIRLKDVIVGQYGNYVIQHAIEHASEGDMHNPESFGAIVDLIMKTFAVDVWSFVFPSFMRSYAQFSEVAESKYGCRVMQLAIATLTDNKPNRITGHPSDSEPEHGKQCDVNNTDCFQDGAHVPVGRRGTSNRRPSKWHIYSAARCLLPISILFILPCIAAFSLHSSEYANASISTFMQHQRNRTQELIGQLDEYVKAQQASFPILFPVRGFLLAVHTACDSLITTLTEEQLNAAEFASNLLLHSAEIIRDSVNFIRDLKNGTRVE